MSSDLQAGLDALRLLDWGHESSDETHRLLQGIAEAVRQFGPALLDTWSADDSPTFRPKFGRTVRLVYVGEFTHRNWTRQQTEPERIYANAGEKVIVYLGNDYKLYAYEAHGDSPVRSLGLHRLDLQQESLQRLRRLYEELISIGLR